MINFSTLNGVFVHKDKLILTYCHVNLLKLMLA